MTNSKGAFSLRNYLIFALSAEIVFVFIIAAVAMLTTIFFKNSSYLMHFLHVLMEELNRKVGAITAGGMAWKIFINNLLISLAPLIIFSLQLLRNKYVRIAAVTVALLVGIFIFAFNGIIAGAAIGAMSIKLNINYGSLLTVTMVHGAFELYALACGCVFPLYFLFQVLKRKASFEQHFLNLFQPAQQLINKLIPVLIITLAAAAVIEVYISAPLAEKITGF